MVMLIPHYLINSSLAMTEAPLLALTLGALVLVTSGRFALAGLLFGLAGLVRPMACFALLGALLYSALTNRFRKGLSTALIAAAVVGLGIAILHHYTGDAFRGIRIYHNSPGPTPAA